MRNDARPVGQEAPGSPVGEHETDARESVTHDRQSHVVNREAEERDRRGDNEPALPPGSTLKTKI
jgi:hypothetical protein